MDLITLVATCALTVDPKLMHALIWHQSGGEPWSVSAAGGRQPQVYRSAREAVRETQAAYPQRVPIRVGLTGLAAESTSATEAMFTPCLNISMAARQIAQLVERCKAAPSFKADPVRCAIAAYHGSWDRPDNKFADVVAMSAVNGDAPNFDMTGNTDVGSGQLTPDVRGARQRASTVARCSSRTAARLVECIVSAEIEAVRPRFDEHQLEHSGCRSAARVERVECTSEDRGNA